MTHFRALLLGALLAAAALGGRSFAAEEPPTWNRTLERIASGVVSIQIDSTRAFDTERSSSAQATGFVVDAQRGLILTNRHVVTPGPVRAQAVFLNQEEVDLIPVYRDPIHDFGFFRYDPKQLQFMKPTELPLVPEAAQIGRDIRVVGNDAGEQLSILAGTIARLDRQAPNYGRGNYNDFNTFYLQAASGTSGGSSGSPVVDIEGRVVALNAGANTQAASSFFLPLDRVQVALAKIRAGQPVPRGELQTEFVHKPFAELRRLGLTRDTEARVRKAYPNQTGMLVVEQVIPQSPAASALQPGDILVEVNGKLVAEFVPLAAALDDAVGREVKLMVERGGQRLEHSLPVTNLNDITPDEYVEYGDGVFHKLSYQQARHFYRPVSGVYVANPGYVFGKAAIPRASIVTAIDGKPVADLNDFERVIESVPADSQMTVRFVTFDEPQSERQRIVRNDRSWFPARRCHRDDSQGIWPCVALAASPPPEPLVPSAGTTFPRQGEKHVQAISPSLVLVNFDMPYTVSGVADRYYYGTGLVADAERGWVVVDRNTVPVGMGDVRLTFAGTIEIPGRVEYIHPLHNLAVVSYDPKLLGSTPVKSAQFVTKPMVQGQQLAVVGLSPDFRMQSQSSAVANVSAASFPLSRTLRFRDTNLDVVSLVNGPTDFDGTLVDFQGRVLGLWASFAYQTGRDLTQVNMGIPADVVVDMLDKLRKRESMRSLEVEWGQMPLATARKVDLPDSWVQKYEAHNPEKREVLAVSSTVAGSPAAEFFKAGDVLLGIDGALANTFREVERAAQSPTVEVTVLRNGQEVTGRVNTVALDGLGIDRVVSWGGALVQAPHRELAVQRGVALNGVYVSYFNFGSPASRSGLFAGRRVVAVDGQPTPDLDAFVKATNAVAGKESVRLNTMSFNDVPEVITMKLDPVYWPSYELRRDGYEWHRVELK
ncbi:MAG TPA: trypsin-like peptidase domain-containing protein [Gammaproteobacteria bacterium]|jgi:S1-C subfamily serine protease|nr:trypsin-like peptidase domain-containing protein [Gammaproteobacteria bacterium]